MNKGNVFYKNPDSIQGCCSKWEWMQSQKIYKNDSGIYTSLQVCYMATFLFFLFCEHIGIYVFPHCPSSADYQTHQTPYCECSHHKEVLFRLKFYPVD